MKYVLICFFVLSAGCAEWGKTPYNNDNQAAGNNLTAVKLQSKQDAKDEHECSKCKAGKGCTECDHEHSASAAETPVAPPAK